MKKIIVISGPTACGKTEKAVEICKKENGEIISCDSRQVYKYLDIGTNKEGFLMENGLRETGGIVQHLTDIIEPDRNYSAADFAKDADRAVDEITAEGKLPVVTGGTGLYIKALLYGLDEMPKADAQFREKLKGLCAGELYRRLLPLDPEAAQKNKKNPQRLLRALEVNTLSGKTMSEHFKPKKPRYDFIHYSIAADNKTLYRKINRRCREMLEKGMIEETKRVIKAGFAKNCPGLSGIGYRHIVRYLDNEIPEEVLLEEFSKDTRHYAKRQNTWFKAQPDIHFI